MVTASLQPGQRCGLPMPADAATEGESELDSLLWPPALINGTM
jgi:hypothetical protein